MLWVNDHNRSLGSGGINGLNKTVTRSCITTQKITNYHTLKLIYTRDKTDKIQIGFQGQKMKMFDGKGFILKPLLLGSLGGMVLL